VNRYLNLWHDKLIVPKPPFYENNAPQVFSHRGVAVFKVFAGHFDFVMAGACIAQRGGATDAADAIDEILDGRRPVADRVAEHINAHGGKAVGYLHSVAPLGFAEKAKDAPLQVGLELVAQLPLFAQPVRETPGAQPEDVRPEAQ
jgi:hypothetical protein